ncbi:protein-serine/threonine phosphatase [Calothrix sp. NIES-4071]|nr:protein-serine/threonine phosphatase [Calothrix sp. NIES-4071]BAZ62484.1 protein-serine/threonine phosphatase [Calothrix sp. NIES-4105]
MEQDAATLYCPNELCQAANPLKHNYCQQCSTPLPKRYLWAVTGGKSLLEVGATIADRYLIISQFVVLDTKPGLVPQVLEPESLQKLRPYLRLFPYRLHVPQVYGIIGKSDSETQKEILLLEKPPLDVDTELEVRLHKSLDSAWDNATSLRQLNWLWQIAHIWQPLASEGVASTLLDPLLLRPEGGLVKILELRSDSDVSPSLQDLGDFWRVLLPNTKSAIKEFLTEVCDSLISGKIHSGEQLVAVLDQGLISLSTANGDTSQYSVKIVTNTDTGPSRQRNEDACYPAAGNIISKPPSPTALAIVCDGIGGHEGGNVASNIAIDVIQQHVSQLGLLKRGHVDSTTLLTDLEKAAAAANDKIAARNDGEGRQGRQRMGTTLVMALPIAHEMYITHVGDSRAYLITRFGCYQVTLDDDVASREVRLGYALYRDAIMQGASGSLVQALGMGSSNSLHPTAQRFVLDEDCVFLLCSDGLSDFDRVEQYWETEILPILTDGVDISEAVNNLTEIANKQNGHDNVTIALVQCQIKYSEPETIQVPNITDLSLSYNSNNHTSNTLSSFVSPNQRTQVIPDTQRAKKPIPLHLIALLSVVVLGSVIGVLLQQYFFGQNKNTETPSGIVTSSSSPSGKSATPRGTLINIKSQIEYSLSPESQTVGNIPVNTTLQVIDSKVPSVAARGDLLLLRVCKVEQRKPEAPTVDPKSVPIIKQGAEIWIQEEQLQEGKNVSTSQPAKNGSFPCDEARKESNPGNQKPSSVR